MAQHKPLFNNRTIKKLCSGTTISDLQRNAAYDWLDRLKKDELRDEKKNYFRFAAKVLGPVLGYPVDDFDFDQSVEFIFTDSSGTDIVCFEAKGTDTDLFAPQHREKKEHETPIKQTWNYMGEKDLDYGICTNYRKFVLITRGHGLKKLHEFDFSTITDDSKLKEFIAIFSRKQIIDDGFVETLYSRSIDQEQDITTNFYNLYHATRRMMIQAFQEKDGVELGDAVHYTQLFLNRLIFVYFAEDNGILYNRLLRERIIPLLEAGQLSENSQEVFNKIQNLFKDLDKGSTFLRISGFNGELFKVQIPAHIYFLDLKDPHSFDEIRKKSPYSIKNELDEELEKNFRKYNDQINPIIKNILVMDRYDFSTDINVNILGHIFEQSIGDIENILGIELSERKKDGVYYTPEYITDYICRNTILPFLSNNGATDVFELITEYDNNIEELEEKIKKIKILDPACGSGAFLIKSVEILLELVDQIEKIKHPTQVLPQTTIHESIDEKTIISIIEKNIFGVDKNNEAVEITKLSLFLKLVGPNRKLIDLSKNIRVGNSLLDDSSLIGDQAFNWKKEFAEVLNNGKFDVVIGNPPYFNVEKLGLNSPYVEGLQKYYDEIWEDKSDILIYFVKKALDLTKTKVGFIIKNAFLFSDKAKKFRNYVLSKGSISEIINFENYYVFDDADVTTAIVQFDKNKKDSKCEVLNLKRSDYDPEKISEIIDRKNLFSKLTLKKDSVFALVDEKTDKLNSKIDKAGTPIGELFKIGSGMQTGLNKIFMSNESFNDFPRQFIKKRMSGDIIEKYFIKKETEYCLYVEDVENFEDLPKIIRDYLLEHKDELAGRADKKRRKTSKWWNYTFAMHKELYDADKLWCSYRDSENRFVFDDTKEYLGFTNTTVIFGTNKKISLKYLLATLHSNLMNFRFRSIGKPTGGGLREYFENGVSKLCIPEIPSAQQQPFIEKTDSLIALNKEFYEKIDNFLELLKQNFQLKKIPKDLEKFYELHDDEFCDELMRNDIQLSLKKQEEWNQHFKSRKKEILTLKWKIGELEMEIEDMVYELYGLTKKEQKIIEES